MLRNAITFVADGITSSWSSGRAIDPGSGILPDGRVNAVPLKKPARFSVIWLVAPRIGLAMWHSPQPAALKIGPSPSAMVSGPVNSSTAASKLHSSSGIFGELGEFIRASWFAQNSSAKPLDVTSNPVGASVGPSDWARSPSPTLNMAGTANTATNDGRNFIWVPR